MRAISIKQPWAWLICTGYKDVENRSWPTCYRGRVCIHAGKSVDQYGAVDIFNDAARLGLCDVKLQKMCDIANDWKHSAVIGEVTIIGCVQSSPSKWAEPSMWHWLLEKPVLYPEPIPMRGRLGFWEVGELPCPK